MIQAITGVMQMLLITGLLLAAFVFPEQFLQAIIANLKKESTAENEEKKHLIPRCKSSHILSR